jgi:TnpA family transposase
MTRYFTVLNEKQQKIHDAPPVFNADQRKAAFYIPIYIEKTLLNIRGSINKAFFLLSYGYFKETAQFFPTVHQQDLEFVCKALDIENKDYDVENYSRHLQKKHQSMILEFFGIQAFDKDTLHQVAKYTQSLTRERLSPREAFYRIIHFLKEKKYEIPRYSVLAKLIANTYDDTHTNHINVVKNTISPEGIQKLDTLITPSDEYGGNVKYKLTHTQRFSHSIKLTKLRENIQRHSELHDIFSSIEPVFKALNLTMKEIKSFASITELNDVIHLKRKNDYNRYLYLVIYTANQFFRLQDILTKSLLNIVKAAFKKGENKAKDEYFKTQKIREESIERLKDTTDSVIVQLRMVTGIINDPSLSDSDKVNKASLYLTKKSPSLKEIEEEVENTSVNLEQTSIRALFLNFIEADCNRVKNLCKPIILALTFDYTCSEKYLASAIKYYKANNGKIDKMAPTGFIPRYDKKDIVGENHFNSDLYTLFFFREIAKSILAGDLSLTNSHKYLGLESILISKDDFSKNRKKFLKEAEMWKFRDVRKLLASNDSLLDDAYLTTNKGLMDKTNTFIDTNNDGSLSVFNARNTHFSAEETMIRKKLQLYPSENSISLVEALATVNKACGFLDGFSHVEHKYLKKRPDNTTFFTCIMALAYHFKTSTFAKLVDDVNNNSVESAMKYYATRENFIAASDMIINFLDRLPVADLFKKDHTSSDGQKMNAHDDSLDANFSFKYGGKNKVLSEYKYADSRGITFDNLLIGGTQPEAHVLFTGIFNSDAIEINRHSTDSHGATLANFAISLLSDMDFTPRIKNFQKCKLYAIKPKSAYAKLAYPLLPTKKIDTKIIENSYEDILRLVVSMKLRVTTSAQVFGRLNSYSKTNPLYAALVELGKIRRTLHLLRYMEDEKYRQETQKQLNLGEHLNRLDRILPINTPDYTEANKEDQELMGVAKMLLKNVMVCWNYMHLSQQLINAKGLKEKAQLINLISERSAVSWKHFLIYGKFDLSDKNAKDSQNFQIKKMLDPKILDI